jgi:hypothetical protein
MRLTWKGSLLVTVTALSLTVLRAQQGPVSPTLGRAPMVPPGPLKTPLKLLNAIAVAPFLSSVDILYVDQVRGRLYIADRSNQGIDIIDTTKDTFIGRIGGFIALSTGGTANAGPNGVLVTPENILWAGDSNSTVQVIDLNAASPQIIKSILLGSTGDGRADELAYDPFDHIILIANDASTPPRVNFINADNYQVLGTINFPDANGMEQPIWDTQLSSFIINVPGTTAYEAVIDPKSRTVTKKFPIADCPALSLGVNGLALGPFQHLLVSACSTPYIMNALDGTIIAKFSQVTGGDEVWYNPGDGQYYLMPFPSGDTGVLANIDATTNTFGQTIPAARGRNLAAYEGNNHVYTVATRPTAGTVDHTPCTNFNIINQGCVAVYGH